MTDAATLIHKWDLPIAQGEAREAWADWVEQMERLLRERESSHAGKYWIGAYPDDFNHSDNSRT